MRRARFHWWCASLAIVLVAPEDSRASSSVDDKSWDRLAVVELVAKSADATGWREALAVSGGELRVLAGNLGWVDLPPEADEFLLKNPGVVRIHRQPWADASAPLLERSASNVLASFRNGEAFAAGTAGAIPLHGDALRGPSATEALRLQRAGGITATCGAFDSLAYAIWPPTGQEFLGGTHVMQGQVTANFFLVESDASGPENVFDWDAAEISLASSEIQEGLVWWSSFASFLGYNLTFVLQLHTPDLYECKVPGDPCLHSAGAYSSWFETVAVPQVMQRMGYTGGHGLCATGLFNQSTIGSGDRAFSGFIVDGNNSFAEAPSHAYAWTNGPYMVSLRRPGQQGTNNLSKVVQHELGHIFRACDEYSSGCTCNPCLDGSTTNHNCEDGCGSNAECVMRSSELEWDECCGWTQVMLGLTSSYAVPAPVFPLAGQVCDVGPVQLRYRPSFGATRYRVQVALDPAFNNTLSDDVVADTTHLLAGLPESQALYWRVHARDVLGNGGSWSPSQFFQVLEGDSLEKVAPGTWITDGALNAVLEAGNVIYLGGSFTRVDPATGNGVPLDATTGLPVALPKVLGNVGAVAPDGAGGWYLGGSFTRVGGVPRAGLARIQADGTVMAWNPGANQVVTSFVVSAGKVYVGGYFTIIGGQPRNRIAALDAVTGVPTAWDPNANNSVHAMVIDGGTMYVSGQFTSIGGQTRSRIAALDLSTGLATGWNPNANDFVWTLAIDGPTLYAGGTFTNIGGQTRNRIAALSTAGTGLATGWNPNADNTVNVLRVSGGSVYAGGAFANIGTQPRNRIAALSPATGIATDWDPNASGSVLSLLPSGGHLYVGGSFTTIGGQPRSRIAEVSATTGLATSWDPSANTSGVLALALSGSTVFAGGAFTGMGGVARNNLAAIDVTTGIATAWDPNANNEVMGLARSGGTIYACGKFSNVGGQTRNRIAALDAGTGAATPWDPSADNDVNSVAVSGNTVYAGGRFTTIGGQPRNRIAALDATGTGLATNWNPNADFWVLTVVPAGGLVYVGGQFSNIGTQARNRLAALDATTGIATSWNPNPTSSFPSPFIAALVVDGGTVYAGGWFTSIGGQTRNFLAALDAAGTGPATAWNPNVGGSSVHSVAVKDTVVYAGGYFTQAGGQFRGGLAALDKGTGFAIGWLPSTNGVVRSIAVSCSSVYAGGEFLAVGGLPQARLAVIQAVGPNTCPIVGAPRPGISGFAVLPPRPNPSSGSVRIDYALPSATYLRIGVYDVQGRLIRTLADEWRLAGRYQAGWDGSTKAGVVAPGVYFVRVEALGRAVSRRIVVLR